MTPDRGIRVVRRAGFTLVELLVAATLALVVMAALASLFGLFSRSVNSSQRLSQVGARMRSAAWRLRQDLQGVTTDVKPFIRPESAAGYFELIEGPVVEVGPVVGDADDILMFTTSSPGRPFRGLISTTTATTTAVTTIGFESPVAEVAWFCKQGARTDDGVQLFNLYRRQLLVAATPGAGMLATTSTTVIHTGTVPPLAWDMYFWSNDLSMRRQGNELTANSLADLTRRHARFMHNVCGVTGTNLMGSAATSGTVPHTLPFSWPQITTTSRIPGASDILLGPREGEDLVLANVIAFDVRVFDPQQMAAANSYVDLGSGGTVLAGTPVLSGTGVPLFSATGSALTLGSGTTIMRMVTGTFGSGPHYKVFDTSSQHTDWNNFNDAVVRGSAPATDSGTNLIDDNANGVVDDVGELEQPPPHRVPLRGVEIRIRCYDPSSQEVRQITVQHSFLGR